MRRPFKRALFVCVNALLVTVLVLQSTAPLWATPSLPTTQYELTSGQGADSEASTTTTGAEEIVADDVERAGPAEVAQQEPPLEAGDLIPVAPVALTLEVGQHLLEPGDTTTLTVGATRAAQEGAAEAVFTLQLTLPEGLEIVGESQRSWPLEVGEPLEEKLEIRYAGDAIDPSGAVFPLTTTVTGEGFAPLKETLFLGVVPAIIPLDVDKVIENPLAEVVQEPDGAVLQSVRGDITLLSTANAVEEGVTFRYTDLMLPDLLPIEEPLDEPLANPAANPAPDAADATAPSGTIPNSVNSDANVFLPLLSAEGSADGSDGARASTTDSDIPDGDPPGSDIRAAQLVEIEPQPIDNILAYRTWQLDALAGGDEAERYFDQPVVILVDVSWLLDRGVAPDQFDLWTREDEKERWQRVKHTNYLPQEQLLVAELEHFSEFSLANGLDVSGELVPSIDSFTTDLSTGASILSYPINVPAGLGGMSPNLSLNYSSSTIDDLFQENKSDYDVQAGLPGLGWGLGGMSYILNTSLFEETAAFHSYQMVLNGRSVEIRRDENDVDTFYMVPETFYNVESGFTTLDDDTNSEATLFHAGEWKVTTPDGTEHVFGNDNFDGTAQTDPRIRSTWMQQSIIVNTQARGDEKWHVMKWHLRESVDTLGNRIEYSYLPETQDVAPCGNDHAIWYHRAALPQEIVWSGNDSGSNDVAPYLRVRFEYAGRTDYKIDGWVGNDCIQAMYTEKRLRKIYVEAYDKDADEWATLHYYILNRSYTSDHNSAVPYEHTLLDNVVRRGADDGFLSKQEFTYEQLGTGGTPEQEDRVHSRWYLELAKNGWGGAVKYKYEQTSNMEECNYSENGNLEDCDTTDYRRRVDRKSVKDVLGNWRYTDYNYGSAAQRHYEYEDTYDFLGHDWVEVNTQPLNQGDKNAYAPIKTERSEFYRGTADDPDSRYGRVQRFAVYDPDTAACDANQQEGGRCLLMETRNTWKTYEHEDTIANPDPNGPTWQLAGSNGADAFGTRSSWPRLEESTQRVDGFFDNNDDYVGGAHNRITYEYDPDSQGGTQYGNVTRTELYDENGLTKSTETEYVPNPPDDGDDTYIVGLPARVLLLDGAGGCGAETRTVYGRGNFGGSYTDVPSDALAARSERALIDCSTGSPPPATVGTYDADWAVTHMAHDDFGNVVAVEHFGDNPDGSQNVRIDTQYDGYYHLFPIQQSNFYDGSFVETAAYFGVNSYTLADSGAYWGRMAQHCDVNGVCTRQRYDEWGRRTRRWDAVPTGEAWGGDATADVYWKYYRKGQQSAPAPGVAEWHSPRCKGNISRSFHDGWGRVLAQHGSYLDWEENFECSGQAATGQEVHTYFAYDALGRQQRASVPEIVARSQFGTIPSQTGSNDWTGSGAPAQTQTSYDVLDRPLRLTAPNGEVTEHIYVNREHHVVQRGQNGEPDRMVQWTATDGDGELSRIRTYEPDGSGDFSQVAEIFVEDNVRNQLILVEHPSSVGNVTTDITYDLGGRKLTMDDPDLGTWSYAYDRHGNLTRQTDAKGQTICLDYDGHTNQLVGKHFRNDTSCPAPGTGPYNVTYSYDESQLTQVAYANGDYQRDLGYDARGFLTSETVTIAGLAAQSSQYVYDEHDRAYATIYPDSSVVKVSFNGMGLPNTLCDGEYNASAGAYFCTSDPFLVDGDTDDNLDSATGVDYNELGQATEMRFPAGGGLWRHQIYYGWDEADANPFSSSDQNHRLAEIRLGTSTNVETDPASHNRLRLRHFYDSHGNLKTLHEQYSAGTIDTHSFAYDDQNRLTDGFDGNTFAYDSAGRLTEFEGEDYSTLLNNNNPVHAIKGPDYAYDANGNMTQRPNYTLTWDHENRLVSVTGGGIYSSEDYLYDADGMRVKKTSDGKETYYPFPHYELHDGVVVKYYFFGGMRVAQRRDGVLTYLHGNHLGSSVLETDTSGNVVNDEQYDAYGSWRGDLSTVNTENQFTDQKRDDTGLYYYGARYYDPELGTFVSPDTIVPDAEYLFSYNRFMYTYGNPLKFVDPSGHIAVCFRGGPQGYGASESIEPGTEFRDACEQTLLDSGYDPAIHGDILKRVNSREEQENVIAAILEQERRYPTRPVILIGHSWGGPAALNVAASLSYEAAMIHDDGRLSEQTATIDLLFLIDAERGLRWSPRSIPSNVKTAVNVSSQNRVESFLSSIDPFFGYAPGCSQSTGWYELLQRRPKF